VSAANIFSSVWVYLIAYSYSECYHEGAMTGYYHKLYQTV